MPETKRLNESVICNGCSLKVNPYVIEERADKINVLCPTCGYDWWVKKRDSES